MPGSVLNPWWVAIRQLAWARHVLRSGPSLTELLGRFTMPEQLRDAVVVVTGASSGIGRATALAFARRGARVIVAARSESALQQLVAECEEVDAQALAVPTDVTDES